MASDESRADIEVDDPLGSTAVHDVARYTRDGETRTYRLHVMSRGAELWRVSETLGEAPASVMETHFNQSDEAVSFLEEIARALKAGGWREA